MWVFAWAYPWEEYLRVLRNFSVVDVLWVAAMVAALLGPTPAGRLRAFLFRSGYAYTVWPLLGALAISTAITGTAASALVLGQLAFVLVFTVPLTVVGLSMLRDPVRWIARFLSSYLALYLLGLALCLGAGVTALVSNAGDNRFFPIWAAMLQMLAMTAGLAVADAVTPGRRLRGLAVGAAALVGILFIGSRSAIVGVLLGLLVVLVRSLSPRQLVTRMVPLVLLCAGAGWGLTQLAELGLLRTGASLEDAYRLGLLARAASMIFTSPKQMLFGLGLGNGILTVEDAGSVGGYQDNFVHNQFVQMALEGGATAAIFLAALNLVPLVWAMRRVRARSPRGNSALLLYMSILPFFLFHPVSTQRVYWLPLAFALAVAYEPPDAVVPRAAERRT